MKEKEKLTVDFFITQVYNQIYGITEESEVIKLPVEDIKHIKTIISRYPKLKKIVINTTPVLESHIGSDISNLIEVVKYMKSIEIVPFMQVQDVKKAIQEAGLLDKIFLSDDGICFLNADKLKEESVISTLKINARDVEKIGIEKLAEVEEEITLLVNNVGELSIEELERFQKAGINITRIKVYDKDNGRHANRPYDIKDYCYIRKILEDLVKDIDINASEKERFAEVYKRVCQSIVYDDEAAYPEDEEQSKYSKEEACNSRNLVNALLKGKCVCSGYADVLRNALAMVGIESKFVSGESITKTLKPEEYDPKKLKFGHIYSKDDKKVVISENHAWNKVKLDGEWYNVDATWDADLIREGKAPQYCLKSDEYIKKKEKKFDFGGPKCTKTENQIEVEKLFDKTHIFIGNYKLPNLRDINREIKEVFDMYRNIGRGIKRTFKKISRKKETPKTGNKKDDKSQAVKLKPWDLKNWGIDRKNLSNITSLDSVGEVNPREKEDKGDKTI